MAYILSDNIVSPLGNSSAENYRAVRAGHSSLAVYPASLKGVGEDFCASLFSEAQNKTLSIEGLSKFETVVFRSAQKALCDSGIVKDCNAAGDAKTLLGDNVLFVMSTTKGNADLSSPADSAKRIARRLGINTPPIVVCNACISGLSALILAKRLVDASIYDYAVVCGADRQGQFIISGFQSLKALSPKECRPFDMERQGLNLGEAAATIVIGREPENGAKWSIVSGAVRNDAYHVSTPSKKADGLYLALKHAIGKRDKEKLAFVNAHGTATLFNDQMESVALDRMTLTDIPVNGLKGYYGHTMGAAGLLETIISMCAVEDKTILSTRGFEEKGVSGKADIVAVNERTDCQDFLKMLSGFGGCNAAVWMSRSGEMVNDEKRHDYKVMHRVFITPQGAEVDGQRIDVDVHNADLLTSLYREQIGGYPKFYKMDKLCRLGFVASELLLKAEKASLGSIDSEIPIGESNIKGMNEERAVIFFNHSSSVYSDRKHLETLADKDNCLPSPSVFVYTLPNIVTGEIAMRNGYHGETSFYLLADRDNKVMADIIGTAFADEAIESVIGGWLDYENESNFVADISIFVKE